MYLKDENAIPFGNPYLKRLKFHIDYQLDIKYLKNFVGKNLSVMKKAVLLQPQNRKFCDIVQPP